MWFSWDMKCTRQNFFVILGHFLPLYPSNSLKNENFKTMKQRPGDIILHKCTKNPDHRLYCSLVMTCDRCNCYFSFWAIFFRFNPLTAQKMKIPKKWKYSWRYHHFTQVYQKSWSYAILFLRYGTPHPFNSPKNEKFRKIKKPRIYHHLTQLYQKSLSHALLFLRYGMWQM